MVALARTEKVWNSIFLLASFFHSVVDVVEARGSQQILTGNGALLDRSGGLLVGQTKHETLSPKLVGTLCTVLPPLTVLGPDATCADVKNGDMSETCPRARSACKCNFR